LKGSLRDQLRDLDFFLSAVRGEPLVMNGTPNKAADHSFANEIELTILRERIARIVELFEAIGADEDLIGAVEWSDEDKGKLLALHRAIVLDEEVAATSDGYGRLDIEVGPFKLATVVAPGSTPGRLRFADAFDPTKRARFRLFRTDKDGRVEVSDNLTVYEALKADELPNILNLHPDSLVAAYETLEDASIGFSAANQFVLTLLSAADTTDGARRARLLGASQALSEWLVVNGEDTLIYKINLWQTRYRLETLSAEDEAEIRTERRLAVRKDGDDARLREACLAILLSDVGELDVILKGLAEDQVGKLSSWPIWSLVHGR